MKKSEQLAASMNKLIKESEAIVALATKENRELTKAEKTRIDAILGTSNQPGELDALKDDHERELRFEARRPTALAVLGAQLDEQMGGNRPSGSHVASANGQRVTILNRGDRYANLVEGGASGSTPYALGELCKAMVCGLNRHTPAEIKAVMTEGNDSAGGVMVPDQLSADVIDLARAKSRVFAAGARMIVMDSQMMSLPVLVGDPTFTVAGELQEIPLSDLKFTIGLLKARKVGTRVQASRELVEDSPTFAMFLTETLAQSLAVQLDYFALAGNPDAGTELTGLLNTPDIDVTGSIGTIDWLDLSAAAKAIRVRNEEPNAAILHPSVHGTLLDTVTGDAVNAARNWLGKPPSLENVAVLDSTNCTATKAVVGDFSKLLFGLRQGMLIEATTQGSDAWEKHGVEFKITWRGDFNVLRRDAFQILTGIS